MLIRRRFATLALGFGVLLPSLAVTLPEAGGATTALKVTTHTLKQAKPYTPAAPNGGTDDYHCSLVNPNIKTSSYIVSAQFFPNSPEVHHAILFLIPPNMVAAAKKANVGGKGWTCFGETALPGSGLAQLGQTPWLTAWAPGHGKDVHTKGAGTLLPAGSMVVMQVHYNMLRGDKPVTSSLHLNTVPVTKAIQPETLGQYVAPPNVPCPTGVTGPLCDRAASLADLSKRFGPSAAMFDSAIQAICGNPPSGVTTTCTWKPRQAGWIVRVAPHMHLTGHAHSMVLNPGTPDETTILDDANYNFDDQKAIALKHPVKINSGDTIKLTCTYDPTLRQKLPQLRSQAPRFITWGDGSSDEMCLGLIMTVPKKPANA